MSLQRRLTLFFILIVILPLAAAGFVVQRVVVREVTRRAEVSLGPALEAATLVYNDAAKAIDDRVHKALDDPRFLALLESGSRRRLDAYLERRVTRVEGLDFLVALDKNGRVVGSAVTPASFVPGFERPSVGQIVGAGSGAGPGFNRSKVPVQEEGGKGKGSAIGGFWLDADFLVSTSKSVDLSVVSDNQVIASTAPLDHPAQLVPSFEDTFQVEIAGGSTAKAERLAGDMALVASSFQGDIQTLSRQLQLTLLGLLVLAILGTGALAYVLARLITQPLEELAGAAHAIAQGDFQHRIPVASRDEVGRLAAAFNDMSDHLSDTVGQLSSSRDQLQRTIRRIGETLRATHDMKQMLQSILNTASDAVRADGAILWSFTATRDELYASLVRGVDSATLSRVRVGDGVVGLVAERATRVMLPMPEGGPRPARGEPDLPAVLAVPLYSQDRIKAVLATYRNHAARPFTHTDLETLDFLVEQAGVAIENVQLHEEAQRLSLTDGLTGVWNRRYFQMQFRQVLATSQRFDRPFSVLMLDLDNFKQVNDTYGHQRGDAILIEFSKRVSNVLREVDTFARYGGEEFICLLSETDRYGAARTAEKILAAIRHDPFGNLDEDPVALTVSIGIASYPEHADNFRALVEAADQAMYRAKQEGRDRACIAGEAAPLELRVAK